MPTLTGMRRRGYPPAAIRDFCGRIGIAKANSVVQMAQLEDAVRQELNRTAPRVMAVNLPLKVVTENYPEDRVEELEATNNPEDPSAGKRKVPFSRELYIEEADFQENPPKKFFRLAPGREVRLRYAYFLTCRDVIKDGDGKVVELRCTYDPETRGGYAPDGRKVRGTIHWVSARHALPATGASLRAPFRCGASRRRARGDGLQGRTRSVRDTREEPRRTEPLPGRPRVRSTSSSAGGTSASIRTRRAEIWSSIGRSGCGTRG